MSDAILSPAGLDRALPVLEGNGQIACNAIGATSVTLREGQWFFGRGDVHVSVLVGASVALVLWSPRQGWGGVCCFAHAEPASGGSRQGLDMPRPAQELTRQLEDRLARTGGHWSGIELSLAGGAHHHDSDVGMLNVAWSQQWAGSKGLVPRLQDVGGRVLRRLTFQLMDGTVRIAHGGRMCSQEM
ncbi:MAG: hypothetical protein HY836_00630 [Aquabacterium sp.]|uniref:hypothetical protein n=1 Tax=Aquabacterium sp. TaxID=1872578 RepID=UPI0025B967B6|nr:hypothetical protein [Aquabacterium sp.]MBI5924085.1 hypothetical protein [Aquabacterium sp.]